MQGAGERRGPWGWAVVAAVGRSYDRSTSQATGGCGPSCVLRLVAAAGCGLLNAVEIEEAVSELVRRMGDSGGEDGFDAAEFPFAFLEAFGNKATTIRKLRSTAKSSTNKTDVDEDGVVSVLQRRHIHLATIEPGDGGADRVAELLGRLTDSLATQKHKAKFALATDGRTVHAVNLASDEAPLVCEFGELADQFGYFLELAGISTVRQIRENAFDIKATGRLNRLYVELLKNNPEWDGEERREELNHFFARLIFCFFAEDTGIFRGDDLFTETIRQMSEPSGENTHFVIEEIFRAMDVPGEERSSTNLRSWADGFPYVNGGLFGDGTSEDNVPKFTQIARSYLLHIGSLDWTKINPDIFGSMIQAVADDEERGALGMHYTSVPNIRKVLDPLFLDDLNAKLEEAGDNKRKLLNLRKRIERIRVFDPACGSGNFLVIAYKEMRRIEHEINLRRGEADKPSVIPSTNFRGIEIRHFAAEIARLALVIAEYQCDQLYLGPRMADLLFLPLKKENWITHGNALRLDWTKVCPPSGTGVTKLTEDDLFQTPLEQAEIDFANEGGETFICGNPPFKGARKQTAGQKSDMNAVFGGGNAYKDCDYVCAWYIKASEFSAESMCDFAFVSTNSISKGEQVEHLWSRLYANGDSIRFAHQQFQWSNSAANNAGVWCIIIGCSKRPSKTKRIYCSNSSIECHTISPYLVPGDESFVCKRQERLSKDLPALVSGSMARDGGNLILSVQEKRQLENNHPETLRFLRPLVGTSELKNGTRRWCIWIDDGDRRVAESYDPVRERVQKTKEMRLRSRAKTTNGYASSPHRFAQRSHIDRLSIIIAKNMPGGESFISAMLAEPFVVSTDLAFVAFPEGITLFSVIQSSLHTSWVQMIAGGLGSGIRYSSQLTYNTFPVPDLTEQNKADLTRCAENILLAREAHWPATIAELYDPDKMPEDLRAAHDANDETLERIYIGRRFKNDTERLEKLFAMYTEMTSAEGKAS